jgi:hypothetical protein
MLMATVLVLGSVAALAATKVVLYGNVERQAKAVAGMRLLFAPNKMCYSEGRQLWRASFI